MTYALQKCRKTIYWAMFFAGISFTGLQTANALSIGGNQLPFLCGPSHTEPVPIDVGSGYKFATVSSKSTVLKAGKDDRRIVRQFVTVKSINPNSTTAWTRSLVAQSFAVALVDTDDDPPTYSIPDTVSLGDRSAVPVLFLASECLSFIVASSGSQNYLAVTLGTLSSTGNVEPGLGGIVVGQDKSALNISILNISNGRVIREFRPRPKPGRFFLIASSGIFDVDNDFNDELVLAYVKFVGTVRYDFIFEHYNIVTGALERTTTFTQFDDSLIQK